MPNPRHHPDCPRCKGEGFYLRREGQGFYRDGSFGHNDWQDCDCYPEMSIERLPAAVDPRRPIMPTRTLGDRHVD
jgi:hypothetical protein